MSEMNDPKWRKQRPVFSGVLMYFPDALREVAHCSYMGNEQHHPGEPLHWDRAKSTDEADACVRHLMESGTVDTDGVRHSAKAAWRALALLQKEIELERLKTSTNHEWNNPKPIDNRALDQAIAEIKQRIETSHAKAGRPYMITNIPCTGCKGFTSFPDGSCDLSCNSRHKSALSPKYDVDMSHEDAEGDPNYWGV